MTWRTPSALKWLIVKHSRLQGTLVKLEREAQELQTMLDAQKARIAGVKGKIAAVEQTLELHEIRIDVRDIACVVPHDNPSTYKHGEMTRKIYEALKISDGWTRTACIVELATGITRENTEAAAYNDMRRMFRRRLRALFANGKVERQLQSGSNDGSRNQSLWRLPRT